MQLEIPVLDFQSPVLTRYTGPDASVLASSVTRPVGMNAFAYIVVWRICMVCLGVLSWPG